MYFSQRRVQVADYPGLPRRGLSNEEVGHLPLIAFRADSSETTVSYFAQNYHVLKMA